MTIGTSRAIAGIIVIGAILGGFFYFTKKEDYATVMTFEECRDAGFQLLESFPLQCKTPDGRVFVEGATSTPSEGTPNEEGTSGGTTGKEDKIQVFNIAPNQLVSSPLTIRGKARGFWYFEASFPVELLDGNGKSIAIAPAQAEGEWMTTEFVPFSVTLTFAKPSTATGTLILHKDNPSGLPEHEEEVRIPVRFSSSERAIRLYYYDKTRDVDTNGTILCSSKGLVPVNRTIPITQTPLQDTVRLLLTGQLTSSERSNGITTEFPLPGVTLTSATISSSGNATLSMTDPNHRTSGGACRVSILRAQVEATAKQFDAVKAVSFSPPSLFQP